MGSNRKKGEQIQESIIKVLEKSDIPVSTRRISEEIKKAWHSVDRHCLKLQTQGKILGFRISNINAWQIIK